VGLDEQVLVIQQLSRVPNTASSSPAGPAALSVNGPLQPIVTMRPGQGQLWRFVNSSPGNLVSLCPVAGLTWRQIAQDGVRFSSHTYKRNARVELAAANRADLLVQAPATAGDFLLSVAEGVGAPAPGSCPGMATLFTGSRGCKPPDRATPDALHRRGQRPAGRLSD
jgi:hypothetical protein